MILYILIFFERNKILRSIYNLNMKKILFLLLFLPGALFSQYFAFTKTYPSESVCKEICKGSIKKFLSDTVEWKVEKKNDRWVTSWENKERVNSNLNKIFSKGIPEYSARTNAGYWFYISIIDPEDDTKIIQTIKFEVNLDTEKIELIEVGKRED